MPLSSVHVAANDKISFFSGWTVFCYRYVPLFLYPFVHNRWLGWLQILGTVNSAAINMWVQTSCQCTDFSSFGNKPSSRIAGSYGGSISSSLRNLDTVFHNGSSYVHSHLNSVGELPFPHILASIFSIFDNSHSNWGKMVPCFCFCFVFIVPEFKLTTLHLQCRHCAAEVYPWSLDVFLSCIALIINDVNQNKFCKSRI